ncbi:TPA: DUF3310 domain-containing protein [Pseudomonas aeruginosa]|nr:DUF3310 domain-containing protein [Pseudomonas aeruginosa]
MIDIPRCSHGKTILEVCRDCKSRNAVEIPSALNKQEGGAHYKEQPIQPVQYIHANGIGYLEGNVIKYVSRWKKKNGIEDLKKAKHYIELLIELESQQESV